MAHYKDKLRQDLDRWIAGGLVNADNREAILATVPDARRLDAATALAWVGGLLLGIAVISFVAANWDVTPKLVRFAIILIAFLGFAGAAAWTARAKREVASNILLMLAALIFAAAIGLTGQIFDIAGDPRAASYGAGLAALALALAGRSTGAATVGLIFVALGDFSDNRWFSGAESDAPAMLLAAPLCAYLALRWGSAALAHVSAIAIVYCFAWFGARQEDDAAVFLFLSIVMGAMAAAARWLRSQDRQFASIFYGWFAWGALMFFAIAGYLPWFNESDRHTAGMIHRAFWLLLSGGALALGRYDNHNLVTTVGVLSIIGAICALLVDLGMDLLASAGVFLLCAVIALVAGLALRKRGSAA